MRCAVRILHWIIVSGAAIFVITPAAAQTYDPRYPVCLQRWEWGGSTYFECSYTSWDQCRRATSGLPAMCLDNPYWSQGHLPSPRSGRC
ncbi:DUF3551 domain-containing protein [Bradyrhizobium centrolobii]|uniref:DUF3551 domain-containing protein n=1 Tax=Bradyrhizobium centrolobii TaxID=1505087 RepID=UPI0010A9522D|nr:DUF3551 domain-containing protein [Bradyrhizobium centrolobii]